MKKVSFEEFYEIVCRVLVDAKNRKTISSYPNLRRLYELYLENEGTPLTYGVMNGYVDGVDKYWMQLIEQVLPATTVWEGGVRYRNTLFDKQKFIYKRGVDEGSEFRTDAADQPIAIIEPLELTGEVLVSPDITVFSSPVTCGFYEGGYSVTMGYDCRADGETIFDIVCDVCDSPFSNYQITVAPRCEYCDYYVDEAESTDQLGINHNEDFIELGVNFV